MRVTVDNPKSHMISFRISGPEFLVLKAVHTLHGARTFSDFARTALLRHMSMEPESTAGRHELEELMAKIEQLQREVQRLAAILAKYNPAATSREDLANRAAA